MEQLADAPILLGDHRQVSGSELTLLETIRQGVVQRPPLVGWNDWQPWRPDHGRVPTQAADGYTLPSQVETALWRATMLEADESRHVGRARLQAAERRQAELLRAEVLPQLQDEPAPVPQPSIHAEQEAMPAVASEVTPSPGSHGFRRHLKHGCSRRIPLGQR